MAELLRLSGHTLRALGKEAQLNARYSDRNGKATIGIFQIPIEKLEEFKTLLVAFYESNNDIEIIAFMKAFCIKRIVRDVTAF